MGSTFRTAFLAAMLSSPAHAGGVWEVGGGGLPTIDDAIALASDGDVILVHEGNYPGFTVAAKSLVIVADTDAEPRISGNIVVHSLAADQSVTLQGLKVFGGTTDPAILATVNDGSLWIEDCTVRGHSGYPTGGAAIEADACLSVVLRRSSFPGGIRLRSLRRGGDTVVLRTSTAFVVACSVVGGWGGCGGGVAYDCTVEPGGPGGSGMLVDSSSVLIQASEIEGGLGGCGDICICCSPTYCGEGGPGGPGIRVTDASDVLGVESSYAGGAGGWAEPCCCQEGADGPAVSPTGSVKEMSVVPGLLEAASPVREGQIATARASGEPGSLLAVYASHAPGSVALPRVFGLPLLSSPLIPLGSAVLPPHGAFDLQTQVPDLGASVQGVALRLQPVGLSTSGCFHLGEPATIVLLDAGL